MSLWSLVAETLQAIVRKGREVSELVERLRAENREVTFTIAVISLGAKLAKVDGRVTVDEIRALKSVFRIAPKEEKHAGRVFNLAKEKVVGFEVYASAVARLYANEERIRDDVLEGLFMIAAADGRITEEEANYLWRVNEIFGLPERRFRLRLSRFTAGAVEDPYRILGVDREWSTEQMRKRWKQLVRQYHPDIVMARGAPPEAAKLAQGRLADYNRAMDAIMQERPQ
ncbi:MAG: molecular chaperone DjiA [Rhodobacteraceae bacterium]|nr:molecular chaperone DjiA [Paracoccaceae bacterium]